MKVLFLAPIVALCSGCAAITPAMMLSGAMGIIEHRQNQNIERRLANIEALIESDKKGIASNYSTTSFLFPQTGLRVRVLER